MTGKLPRTNQAPSRYDTALMTIYVIYSVIIRTPVHLVVARSFSTDDKNLLVLSNFIHHGDGEKTNK